MRWILWVAVLCLLSVPVFAQTANYLKIIDAYGDYLPESPEDLRLPDPDPLMPPFGDYQYKELLSTSIVSGVYYSHLRVVYPDFINASSEDFNKTLTITSLTTCNVTGLPKTKAESDCVKYFWELGLRASELWTVTSYKTCRGNIASDLTIVNTAVQNNEMKGTQAGLRYATLATALKWCQGRFGKDLTVIPPEGLELLGRNITEEPPVVPESKSYAWLWWVAGGVALLVAVAAGIYIARK